MTPLGSQLQQREQAIARLQEQVGQLQEQLATAKRAGKHTPFAREKRVAKPKRPGSKKGQGRFSYRRKPAPTAARETKTELLVNCPACGGPVSARKQHEQYVVDIPPVEPVITRYVTDSRGVAPPRPYYCAHGRQRVRSRHPEGHDAAVPFRRPPVRPGWWGRGPKRWLRIGSTAGERPLHRCANCSTTPFGCGECAVAGARRTCGRPGKLVRSTRSWSRSCGKALSPWLKQKWGGHLLRNLSEAPRPY